MKAAPPEPKKRKVRGERIYWTEEEWEVVAKAAAEKRFVDINVDLVECLRAGVAALPADRQRHVQSMINFRGAQEKIQLAYDVLKAKSAKPPEVQMVTVEVTKDRPLAEVLANASTTVVVAEVLNRLFTRLDRLQGALEKLAHNGHGIGNGFPSVNYQVAGASARSVAELIPEPARARRVPRVAIVGFFRDQFEHLKAKVADKAVELVFVDKEARQPNYPAVDAVVMERHISHRWKDGAEKTVAHNRIFNADGISSAVQRLYDYLSRCDAEVLHQ